jgi:hypothetical protein
LSDKNRNKNGESLRYSGDGVLNASPGDDSPDEEHGLQQRDRAMGPFEHDSAREKRHEAASAEGPIRAGHSGSVDANPTSQDGKSESRSRARNGEVPKAFHNTL